jgi:hypothetical protein
MLLDLTLDNECLHFKGMCIREMSPTAISLGIFIC